MRGRSGPRRRTWAAAVLLVLAWPAVSSSQGGPPNLRPFQPPSWPDSIVVSNRQGDNADGRVLQSSDRLYVDFAVINSGESPVSSPFRVDLYVDGRLIRTFDVPAPLAPQGLPLPRGLPHRRLGGGHPHPANRSRRRRLGGRKRRGRQRLHPDDNRGGRLRAADRHGIPSGGRRLDHKPGAQLRRGHGQQLPGPVRKTPRVSSPSAGNPSSEPSGLEPLRP